MGYLAENYRQLASEKLALRTDLGGLYPNNSKDHTLREYGRLLEILDNYPKYVLLDDDYAGGNYQGIKTIHNADFLLSKDF